MLKRYDKTNMAENAYYVISYFSVIAILMFIIMVLTKLIKILDPTGDIQRRPRRFKRIFASEYDRNLIF